MTKRDFVALAAALRTAKPEYIGDKNHMDYAFYASEKAQWMTCVRVIMEACETANPNFNRNKFVTACGAPNVL